MKVVTASFIYFKSFFTISEWIDKEIIVLQRFSIFFRLVKVIKRNNTIICAVAT